MKKRKSIINSCPEFLAPSCLCRLLQIKLNGACTPDLFDFCRASCAIHSRCCPGALFAAERGFLSRRRPPPVGSPRASLAAKFGGRLYAEKGLVRRRREGALYWDSTSQARAFFSVRPEYSSRRSILQAVGEEPLQKGLRERSMTIGGLKKSGTRRLAHAVPVSGKLFVLRRRAFAGETYKVVEIEKTVDLVDDWIQNQVISASL